MFIKPLSRFSLSYTLLKTVNKVKILTPQITIHETLATVDVSIRKDRSQIQYKKVFTGKKK